MAELAIGAVRVVEQVCIVCSSRFSYSPPVHHQGRLRRFCSDKCKAVRAREQKFSYRTPEHDAVYLAKGRGVSCEQCGKTYRLARGGSRFCSMACYADSIRTHPSPRAARAAEASRRRARKRTTQIERFTKVEIYERDGWVCQICDEPIDRTVEPPHHMSASLDHRIALANGGAHTRENVQCAHWICNSRKGAR